MKAIKFTALFLAIAAMVSCQQEEFQGNPTDAITVNATIGEGIPLTRVNSAASDATQWDMGDKIAVSNGGEFINYTYAGSNTWTTDADMFLKWNNSTMTFNAYYPVSAGTDMQNFTLPGEQSDLAKISAADYMTYSGSHSKPASGYGVDLPLERKTARVIVKIAGFGEQYTSAQKTVSGVKISSPAASYYGGSANGAVKAVTPFATGTGAVNSTYTALVIPTASADGSANFVELTDGQGTTLYIKGIPVLEAGKSYAYDVTVGKDVVTITSVKVTDWATGDVIPDGDTEQIFSVWDGTFGDDFASDGNGTAESPYIISNARHLACITSKYNDQSYTVNYVHFRLETDIDLAGHEWVPIGRNGFKGVFDGNGHVIKGLKITTSDPNVGAGFFGKLMMDEDRPTIIKNLHIIDADINIENNSGNAGILAAEVRLLKSESVGRTNIENVHVSGKVLLNAGSAAGLVSTLYNADVSNCSADVTVSSFNTPSSRAAGFVGIAQNSTFVDCSVSGSVKGKANAGGFFDSCNNNVKAERCVVSNMRVESPYPLEDAGCFVGGFSSYIGWGTIIKDCNVNSVTVVAPSYGGGFAGWIIVDENSEQTVSISNCTVSGSVTGGWSQGGFVGVSEGSKVSITNSRADVNILTNDWEVGGFVGLTSSNITGCSTSGNITSQANWGTHIYRTGGFCGTNAGIITSCTASGLMTFEDGPQYYGAFVGNDNNGQTVSCRFDGSKNPTLNATGLSVNNQQQGSNDIQNTL